VFVSKGPACLLHKATDSGQKLATVTSFSLNPASMCVPAAFSLEQAFVFTIRADIVFVNDSEKSHRVLNRHWVGEMTIPESIKGKKINKKRKTHYFDL